MARISSAPQTYLGAAFAALVLTGSAPQVFAAADISPLGGKIVSATGQPLVGIPVKAHRANSGMTIAVYSDAKGEYSFPSWSDVTPGAYELIVDLPDFEHVKKDGVAIAAGKTAKVDLTLKSKPVAYDDATASEIIAGLPGTDKQKVLFSQCSNCHTLQWALQIPRTHDGWVKVIKMMAGRAATRTAGRRAACRAHVRRPAAVHIRSPPDLSKPHLSAAGAA